VNCAEMAEPTGGSMGGDGDDHPRKIFLDVSENKSRDRKLSNSVCVVRLLCQIAITWEVLRTF